MVKGRKKVIVVNQRGSSTYYDEDNDGQVDNYQGKEASQSLVNKFINSSPFELHLPGASFTGPGTKFRERIKELNDYEDGLIDEEDCKFKRCSQPLNRVDESALLHDWHYSKYKKAEERWSADRILLRDALNIARTTNDMREKLDALFVASVMKAKLRLKL
jgi:hypothetical protein